jgi:hypothetical protein
MEKNPSVTIKNVPPPLWKRIKLAAVAADKNVSEFALELLQKAMNREGRRRA